jgi:glutamyl-tRNA reductase
MDLLLVGASHRTAPVDVRGRLAARAATLAAGWRPPHAGGARHELFVLSTCHRVEVLAAVGDVEAADAELRRTLVERDAVDGALVSRVGQTAVDHLCRVAAGLESLIVGEAEISGQVRRAAAAGRAAGLVGPLLDRVVAGALRASGRARSETRIGQGAMSAATAAVALLEAAWSTAEPRAVLVIGAGEAARQALGRLAKRRVGRLLVASRSPHHAGQAARMAGAEVVAIDRLPAAIAEVDGVIAATRAAGFVVDAAMCRAASAASAHRRLAIVDLSVPPVVDPAVALVPGVVLRTVDDLGEVVRGSIDRRAREVPRVERIVADEAARTYRQFIDRRHRPAAAVA